MNYDIIIGLEIHAELNTKSKMFCSCLNKSDNLKPNINVCPVCLGHPGTLPVPNKLAIEKTILLALALNCQINQETKFDRKNYFYPDLPKGYQISQYDKPFGYDGYLEFDEEKIDISRIHLEEDTGKIFHDKSGQKTLIDFNRAGTALLEMVTKPIIKDALQAKIFCQNFQRVLRYLNISFADMEKGEMRCEANISLQTKNAWYHENGEIKKKGKNKLNHKVEVKNINSFKSLEKAINYEIKRQAKLLDEKQNIVAETRGWQENKAETVSQRKKETAADYRYFKEPDIPQFYIDDEEILNIKKQLIELPMNKKKRFIQQYGIKAESADILVNDRLLADFYEKTVSELGAWIKAEGDEYNRQEKKLAQTAANWINGELLKHLKTDKKSAKDIIITAENMAELISLVWREKINSNTAQDILKIMYKNGGDPSDIMDELGLMQIDNSQELDKVIKRIIDENKKQVEEYQAGKLTVLKYLIGQVMAATKGKANPKIVKELLEKNLNK
jgi:aspartyl-tRNA(Asn)/glutamyl-tRNA(Gln) amidotransferase subunit B